MGVLEKVNARSKISLRLIVYELKGLSMNCELGCNIVVDCHLLLLADEAKTIDNMFARQAAEFKACTTR